VVLELELEDEVLLDVVLYGGHVHGVAQQGQARQRKVVLQHKTEGKKPVCPDPVGSGIICRIRIWN